nr:unnamed protein product [Naegleria fowleri]
MTPGMNSEDGIRIIEKASEEWMDQQLHTITIMTHNTESCMITTCILVRFGLLVQLFGDQFVHHKMEIINNLIGYCKELEKKVLSNNEEHEISCRLQLLKENLEHLQDDTTLIQVSNEGTYESVNSLIMVIGVILSLNVSESKPFKLVLRAGTIGGDCDSNAAMVGALIGTVFGKSVLPHSFITHLIDRDKLMEEAAQFAEALEKTR